jgi:hypothetical protein
MNEIETSTTPHMTPNGAAPTPATPVRYGPGPDQVMPHSWAEFILSTLARENERVFTRLVGQAAVSGQNGAQ